MTDGPAAVRAAQWPDSDAFSDWVRPHLAVMSRVAAAFVQGDSVDDVVQESLLRAWKRRETYDAARGSAAAWLAGITARQGSRHRARTRRLLVPHRSPALTMIDEVKADHELRGLIAELPTRQREVIVWFFYVDLPVDAIASLLGIAAGTVKSTLSDARAALARQLEGEHR